MSSNLTSIVAGTLPLASDVQQFIDMFNGINDVGAITLAQPISSPSISGIAVAAAPGSALGVGTYKYAFTWVVGYKKTDGTFVFGGETPASATITLTTTSGNQSATLTGLPTTWPSTALALRIYRTAVGASTLQIATTITAKQSVYNDTTPDSSLTNVQPPSANTTGTVFTGSIASVRNVEITGTSTQTILTFTPRTSGHYELKGYLRVVTAATNIAYTLTYTDSGGAQTFTPPALNNAAIATGSHSVVAYSFEAIAGSPITLSVTAGTANQVYVTAALVPVA